MLVGAGVYTFIPSFWSLPGRHLSGVAAAVSVGLINSIENLAGFVGPYLMGWLQSADALVRDWNGVLLAFQVAAGLLVFALKPRNLDSAYTPHHGVRATGKNASQSRQTIP